MKSLKNERDYYAILQVHAKASGEEIEAAYNRLSQAYDPEISRKPRAAERLREITEAFEILSDKKRRSEYDLMRSRRRSGKPEPVEPSNRFIRMIPAFLGNTWVFAAITMTAAVVSVAVIALVVTDDGENGAAGSASPAGQTPAAGPDSPPEVTGTEVTSASGLKYIDIRQGTGASPSSGQRVSVHYTGWLEASQQKFDSSVDRGQPFTFTIGTGEVILGWDEGIITMNVGGTRRLIVRPDLAYGAFGFGDSIPGDATLIFDVELLAVE